MKTVLFIGSSDIKSNICTGLLFYYYYIEKKNENNLS